MKSLAEKNATGEHDDANRWLKWERINGGDMCPTYMYRLTLLRLPGGRRLYPHKFVGDDWCTDPHDHPKTFLSIGLWGWYWEDVYKVGADGLLSMSFGMVTRKWRAPWIRKFPATHIHRIRASECKGSVWTLVYTGPLTYWQQMGNWMLGEK